jgi:hypothetical protein
MVVRIRSLKVNVCNVYGEIYGNSVDTELVLRAMKRPLLVQWDNCCFAKNG